MPPTLPIPSKGALRTLRNLALGTTCTIAFTTGVLTEDRRRRIHSAQKVRDNAKKIKASRNYHGSGAAEAIEEKIMRNQDDCFWQVGSPFPTGSVTTDRAGKQSVGPADENLCQSSTQSLPIEPETRRTHKYDNVHVGSPMPWTPIFPPRQASSDVYQIPKVVRIPPKPPLATSEFLPMAFHQSESRNTPLVTSRQHRLASDILSFLREEITQEKVAQEEVTQEDITRDYVAEAVARFFDAFEEGLPVDGSGISQELIAAAAQLSNASIAQKDFGTAEKIVQTVLSRGKLDLEEFLAFNPEAIMRGLILSQADQNSESTAIYKANLRKACSLYLTNFKTKPKDIPKTMLSVGKLLCNRASQYELFDLVEGLYWRVQRYNDGTPQSLVKHLILAAHNREEHAKVLKYFRRFYTEISPNKLEFYTVLGAVMKSIFDSDRHRLSEEILVSATRMAQREGLSTSTTWFLKALGHDWRTYRDIAQTRALFDRLRPHLRHTSHPQAAYGAIIQFCIEANDEPAAATYYELLKELHDLNATDVRIHGHFTLAKAMRNDWSGVEENLFNMKQMGPNLTEFSASFAPILRLFTRSHNVHETEEFLLVFIRQCGGLLTPSLSTIMINEYLKAAEFDSVSRWLAYMASVNCLVDSSFFNLILKDCYYKYKLSYEEVQQLYQSVARRDALARRFVDSDTLSILREIAVSSPGKNVAERVKRLQYLKLHVPIKRTNCGREIREAMTVAMAKGNPARALKMYRRALNDQIPLSESTITIAMRAALELDPENFDTAACLIQDSQQNGQSMNHALSSMFVLMISRLNCDSTATTGSLKDMAHSAVSTLNSHGISMPTSVITHTMGILINQQQSQEAVDFWNSVSHRDGCPSIPVDLYVLTALLRAYVRLRDPAGVQWVVQTLCTENIAPDRRFQQTLVKACREAEKLIAPYFNHSVVEALNTVNTMRADATRAKENAKMEILKIMEDAISTHRIDHPDKFDSSEADFDKLESGLPGFSLAERSKGSDSWMHPTSKPIMYSNNKLQAGWVGVTAG